MRGKRNPLRRNRRHRLLWLAAIVALPAWFGLSGCQVADTVASNVQRALEAAGLDRDREPGRNHALGTIRASGTIQADEVRIASETGGRILEIHAQAGERVQAGELVVLLDASSLSDKLAEAEAAVHAAQADLAALQAGTRQQEIDAARAALSLATARHEGAQRAWENAREALQNPQELDARIIEAGTQVKLAEQGAILAEAQLASERLLAQQKREGTDEREAADWQVKAAEAALAAAQADHAATQTLLDWLTYIRNEPLAAIARANAAQGEAQIAEAGIDVAQARLEDLKAGPTRQEVAVAQQRVRLAQAQANVLQAQVDRFALHSPVEGIVLEEVLHKGELAAPATPILTLAGLDPAKLTVYVPVGQVGRIHLGQEVQATVDSFADRAFAGRVTRIGDQAEYTPRNVATPEERLNTFYAVDIELDNADHALKPGMPADVKFVDTALPGAQAD
jgi:HlyD family secretion protein